MSGSTGGGQSRSLILTAMIFAVAMTFIDDRLDRRAHDPA